MDSFEFWITIAGIVSGFLGLTLKMCLKSRCEDISICYGLFNIHRNVEVEEHIEMGVINRSSSTNI